MIVGTFNKARRASTICKAMQQLYSIKVFKTGECACATLPVYHGALYRYGI